MDKEVQQSKKQELRNCHIQLKNIVMKCLPKSCKLRISQGKL